MHCTWRLTGSQRSFPWSRTGDVICGALCKIKLWGSLWEDYSVQNGNIRPGGSSADAQVVTPEAGEPLPRPLSAPAWGPRTCVEEPWGSETVYYCSVAQSCPTLYNPMDCSPPGSSVCGISQARILGWVAISSSRGSSRLSDRTHVSCVGRWILSHWATWEDFSWALFLPFYISGLLASVWDSNFMNAQKFLRENHKYMSTGSVRFFFFMFRDLVCNCI